MNIKYHLKITLIEGHKGHPLPSRSRYSRCCGNYRSNLHIRRFIRVLVSGRGPAVKGGGVVFRIVQLGIRQGWGDEEKGYFGNVNNQVDEVCEKIAPDPELQKGGRYHAMGFSQGGQCSVSVFRAIAERCPQPAMRNLITFGGQHQGIFGLPNCPPDNLLCEEMRRLLNLGAYIDWIQNSLVQAQYWHDPLHENEYRNASIFLADINNAEVINESYRENLKKLENFVMVKFEEDSMVVPPESEWFGFYSPGQDSQVLPLQQTQLYIEDRLGLKEMDEAGKLHFLSLAADHLNFDDQWFLEEIVDKFVA
nr:LOW QUALITY PROTEIN: palmitoyl-protein thioesterase 1-like [Penaeus vannamei]